tara:strand:+ start:17 stop:517 length:501 start_codon:yes stop_codon:yes gene_type:complete
MKTRKLNKSKKINAICVLHVNKDNIYGTVKFTEKNKKVKIEYEIFGLKDGKHGFHIHEYGDLTDGCTSSCAHFNPYNKNHGGLESKERHVGDLGNIISKNNVAKGIIKDHLISLKLKSKCCIIGRCVVIHKDADDLGLGKNKESLKTGNAGKRLCCGVIGISKKCK